MAARRRGSVATPRITADTEFRDLKGSEVRALARIEFERRRKLSAKQRGVEENDQAREAISEGMRTYWGRRKATQTQAGEVAAAI